MPRPVKDDPRDRFKTFRFTEAEVTRLEARARASGGTLSDYVRDRVLDSQAEPAPGNRFEPGGSDPHRSPSKNNPPGGSAGPPGVARRNAFALRMLAEQLRKVGVNLNQIAKRMNEQRIRPPRELTMLLDEIRSYVRRAREP
jgi:hypothetical protein